MATTTSEARETNRPALGSMDVLTASVIGIFVSGIAFGFCYGLTMGIRAAFIGSMTGGAYATVGGTIALPFILLVAAWAKSELSLKVIHTIGGAVSSFIACLPMIGRADSIGYVLLASVFGAIAVLASLTWSIRSNGLQLNDADSSLLFRLTR